jgi:hypothetical protein
MTDIDLENVAVLCIVCGSFVVQELLAALSLQQEISIGCFMCHDGQTRTQNYSHNRLFIFYRVDGLVTVS